MPRTLEFEDLEIAYDILAEAIDNVGQDNEKLFLAKLGLAFCHKLGDLDEIRDAITMAQTDL